MAPFRFRLESLLRLRKQARDTCRTDLAQAYQAQSLLQSRMEETLADIGAARGRQSPAPGIVDVDLLLDAARWEFVLSSQRAMFEKQSIEVAREVEVRRQALAEADRQVRLLENLRDKQQRRHQSEQQRLEMKTLDEVAGLNHYLRNESQDTNHI